jgi:hypothetical protein
MMKNIEVFVHKDGQIKTITIENQETIDELLKQAAPEGHAELDLFVEDKRHERHHRLCDVGIGHHRHVHCRHKEHKQVQISINGKDYRTHTGNNSVRHLRNLGHVPETDVLSQLRDGSFVDLDNNAHVIIRGQEVFVSHPPSTGSS